MKKGGNIYEKNVHTFTGINVNCNYADIYR